MNEALIYIGAAVVMVWGVAHLIPTRPIVRGFGAISADNKKVLAMEVIAEGLTLIFLGVLPILVTILAKPETVKSNLAYIMAGAQSPEPIVYLASAVMLLVMALLTLFTGARTKVIWYKICPLIPTPVAVLYILGAVL
ncbi:MAG: hypothetical protein ABR886_06380 [Dehalococcoidales bacterium]|jgi:uncharacterized integral membrane protein